MSSRDPKRAILDAALATFVELGFGHATVAHVCTRAGISNGALFHHFPSKDAVAEALYLRGIAAYQEGLLQELARHRGARATIEAAVRHHLAWVEAHRDLAWFMYERGRPDWQPAQGAAVRKLNRAVAVHVRDWIAPLAAAGEVRDLPLPVLAACVIGPAHFVARRWLSGLIAARPGAFAEALAEAAWAALAPGRPRAVPGPARRVSAAALVEAAALDAAGTASPAGAAEDWAVAQLSMTRAGPWAEAQPVDAAPQSVELDGNGAVAVIVIDLLDAEGRPAGQGQAICIKRSVTGKGSDV
jgi:AcrR family transcriptional regulator